MKYVAVVSLVIEVVGCNEPFSPKGTYEEKVVVYSILSTRSDTQYVRVYSTCNPSGFDPFEQSLDTQVTDAQVTISQGSVTYQLRDTTLRRLDKSRYNSDLHAYVVTGLTIQPEKVYMLSVKRRGEEIASASLTVPGLGSLIVETAFPFFYNDTIYVTAALSVAAQGYLLRMYFEYEILKNNVWVLQRTEVPSYTQKIVDCTTFEGIYPRLQRSIFASSSFGLQPMGSGIFLPSGFLSTLKKIRNTYGSGLRFKRMLFELTQVEHNLYSYYNIAHGFRDEFSIRPDEPDFTNIRGGVGVFGAFLHQSFEYSLPDTVGLSLGCR